MNNADFWNRKFSSDYAAGTSIFLGEPNATIAAAVEKIGHPAVAITSEGQPRPRAIDLGSGRGRHTVWLARNGWDVTALDFSEVGLEHTRLALAAEGLHAQLICADLAEWNPEPESYDLVVAAFIHLPPAQQAKLWQATATALRPGGHLVSVSHHPDNKIHGPANPELLYTAEEVAEQFARLAESGQFGVGFEVEVAQRSVVKQEGDKQAVDAVVVLRKD